MRTKDKLISNWKDVDEEIEIKTENLDSVVEEIILCDSVDQIPSEEIPIGRKEEDNSKQVDAAEYLAKNILLRGLLPHEGDKAFVPVFSIPVVKRCCIEHCYFSRHRSQSSRYNLRSSPGNTLQFENENSNEQQTVECLAPQDVNSSSDSVDKNNVRDRRKGNQINSSISSSSSSSSGSEIDNFVDDSNDRDYCPDGNSTDSDNGSVSSVKEVWKSGNKNEVAAVSVPKTSSFNRIAKSTYPKPNIPSDFVSVHDLLAKIRNMQKLMKTSKKFGGETKGGKVPVPRLKKMSRGKREEFSKMPEYLFPVPNLTKMVNGDKNWGVEYDEVQSLGLDDLLLKASELNAENFTKALGRKLKPTKPNFNAKDNSEIVFTIPKSKDSVDEDPKRDGADGEFAQRPSTVKLDISKPFFEADKAKEPESSKPSEETSPKRPGIKVKTVENINEEFKDSLGLKNNLFQDCSMDKGMSLLDNFRAPTMLEKEGRQDDPDKTGEGRPFIMTIIQSKTEKQRPAILRNSSYFKRKTKPAEKSGEGGEGTTQSDPSPEGLLDGKREENRPPDSQSPSSLDKGSFNGLGLSKSESFNRGHGKGRGSYAKETEPDVFKSSEKNDNQIEARKRNIPFILKRSRKPRITEVDSKLVKVNEPCEKVAQTEKAFKVTSIEQKLGPKEANRRFIKVVPYEPANKPSKAVHGKAQQKLSDDESEKNGQKSGGHVLSLTTFYSILKEILPDKWVMCLDNKYGLQIFKTHVDKLLNPSILISVVIARCGKVTVNVRGKQLQKSHELFSDLCDIRNSDNKLSLNYVLTILNRLRCLSVCFGCDDPMLKKYWREDGFVEHQTELQQVFRSNLCQLLVSLGKKRCSPCYKLNETLKILHRRDKVDDKPPEKGTCSTPKEPSEEIEESDTSPKARGVKRNLEDFLEESFSTMKQQITDEIEKNKKLGEQENAMKTQEEVLSFMGLARKDSLDNPVRKSKRKKNSFYKLQQPVVKKKIDQQELEFLEKYWTDINTLFSTSLLFGAYSRTGRGRLKEKCRMFQKLLTTWRNIVKSNPEWIGGEISLPDELADEDSPSKDPTMDYFEKMDVPALRSYIINSVKEVNRIKHKLRTRNSYFKILYNKFVKRRMKRSKALPEAKGTGSSANSTTNTPTPTDLSSDDSSRDKGKTTDDESRPVSDLIMTCVSDGD